MVDVKVNGITYPAEVEGMINDYFWDGRESKSITLKMNITDALELFVDDIQWSIIYDETEYDNSDFNVAGDITDHRDGTITVKMGKETDLEEAYEMIYGGNEDE